MWPLGVHARAHVCTYQSVLCVCKFVFRRLCVRALLEYVNVFCCFCMFFLFSLLYALFSHLPAQFVALCVLYGKWKKILPFQRAQCLGDVGDGLHLRNVQRSDPRHQAQNKRILKRTLTKMRTVVVLGVAAGVAATAALVQWKWQEITRAGDQLVLLWASRRKGVAAAQVPYSSAWVL